MSDKIVPFGKHKGRSVEALLDDRPYLDWLLSQSWFKERFGDVYNIVINNGQEPSETPEHNAMQIKFLSEEFRLKFIVAAGGNIYKKTENLEFEKDGIDVQFWYGSGRHACIEIKPTIGDDFPAALRQIKRYKDISPDRYRKPYAFAIFALLVGSYTGIGATEEQFKAFFKSQGVTVVFERDVETAALSEMLQ
jgi:uncharacterized protein (DUF3820 family)